MLGRSHQEKNDGRFWTDPVLKEAYLRLQTGSGKPRLEFVSDLLGNFFSSRGCKHHKKNRSVVEQLNADERAPEVLTPADLLNLLLSGAHAVYFGPARGQGQAAAQIHEQQKTQFRNTAVSQDQLKNVPKYFQRWNHVFGSYFQQKSLWYCLYPWFDLLWAKCLCCSKNHMLKS